MNPLRVSSSGLSIRSLNRLRHLEGDRSLPSCLILVAGSRYGRRDSWLQEWPEVSGKRVLRSHSLVLHWYLTSPIPPRVRVAVVGAGHFGKNHIRVCSQSPNAELVAIVDPDPERLAASDVPPTCQRLLDGTKLPGNVDAVICAAPTSSHESVGLYLLQSGLDVLMEKPIALTLQAADRLITAARDHHRILQVGHLERFNPIVVALEEAVTLPLFFEVHRMSVFSPRSLDVDVVLDLMIHDLDIVLSLARGELQEIRAAGVSVLSRKVDIANVRLQFSDGCVANMTASRVSVERIRKLRLFQPRQYITLDYAKQDAAEFTVGAGEQISFRRLPVTPDEPLKLQFESFIKCVRTRSQPKLDGPAARRTLGVALAILDNIEQHSQVVDQTLSRACKP
jgi:predicted dehydrogenase